MANGYDDSFSPPPWWLEKLAGVMTEQGWSDGDVIKMARERDGRRKWGPDRVVKLREGSGTIQMVIAISEAVDIPPPVFVPTDLAEAEAFNRWMKPRRNPQQSGLSAKEHMVDAALDKGVRESEDQTKNVSSDDEGSPRGRGHRRAPDRRSKTSRS